MFKRTALALCFLSAAALTSSAQKAAAPCVANKAASNLRLSTKMALSYVTHPVLPRWKPAAEVKTPYPVVAFIRVDDCGVVKVIGVRTPHPPKLIAKDVEAAVTKALLQWKFRPYDHQGHRLPFQFALPFTVSDHGVELDTSAKVDTEPFPK